MKNLSNTLSIKVVGTLIGTLWMPCDYGTLEFSIDVTRERSRQTDGHLTIREALEDINRGDFRSASIATGYVSFKTWNNEGNREQTRYIDLKDCESVSDLMADAEEMEAFESIAYGI